jgi:hypothetical protein
MWVVNQLVRPLCILLHAKTEKHPNSPSSNWN